MECHMVISTGFFAFFNAETGHASAAPTGTVLTTAMVPTKTSTADAAPNSRLQPRSITPSPVVESYPFWSTLHCSGGQAAYELLLEGEQQDDQWNHRNHRSGERHVDVLNAQTAELLQP